MPETDRVTFQALAVDFIVSADGPARLAQALAKEAHDTDAGRVIVDGIRHVSTYQRLKALSDLRTNIVYVMTPVDIAYEFYRRRENPDVDFLKFASLRESEVESNVPHLLKLADAVLYNWTDKDQYLSEVRKLLEEVGISAE